MKYSNKHYYKPGLTSWIMACALVLAVAGCGGGGDSEPADAAPPPAPSGDSSGDSGDSGEPADPADPAEPVDVLPALTLRCSATPGTGGDSGFTNPGGNVTATFIFNQPFNGTGDIASGTLGGVLALEENVNIDGTSLAVNRTAPGPEDYRIRLNVDGTGLVAACTFNVSG